VQHAIEVGGNWVEDHQGMRGEVLAGWLVCYDFAGDGHPDHVEIGLSARDSLSTIGFNTSNVSNRNGGAVAYRTRGYPAVLGYVRFD
jgi:hypothetical protein